MIVRGIDWNTMQMRTILNTATNRISAPASGRANTLFARLATAVVLTFATALPRSSAAQDHPGKRLAGIVAVALDEYAKGVDQRGRLIAASEYDEAASFLVDAREVAGRLTGGHTAQVRALVDTIAAAVRAKVPPVALEVIHQRLVAALGPDAALDMPTRRVDLARGQALFGANCAACHGAMAEGNGPAAKGLTAQPPALVGAAMHEKAPATMYRVISVGVAGTAMAGWASSFSPDDRWDIVHYLASLRSTADQVARGDSIWKAQHDVRAKGATLPAELSRFEYAAERSDAQLALSIKDAGAATGTVAPMNDADVNAVVAFVRALPTTCRSFLHR